MNTRKNFDDWLWLTLAAAPVFGLIAIFAIAAMTWQARAATIKPQLLKRLPEAWVEAESPEAMAYAETTSRESTKLFREIEYAALTVHSKHSVLLELLDRDEYQRWYLDDETDPRLLAHVNEFVADAEPLLKAAQGLSETGKSVWLPIEFSNPNRGQYHPADLNEILEIVMEMAVQDRDAERFGRLVELLGRDGLRDYRNGLLVKIMPQAATVPMWSADDIGLLQSTLAKLDDPNVRWAEALNRIVLDRAHWMLGKPSRTDYRNGERRNTYAPSERLQSLRQVEMASRWNIDSISAIRKAQESVSQWDESGDTPVDVTVQFPTYGQTEFGWNVQYLVRSHVGNAYQLRFVRTAIALRISQLREGSFPEDLERLVAVGMARQDLRDPLGSLLLYHANDSGGCTLGSASRSFVDSALQSFQTPEDTLATLLNDFQVLEFSE